MPKSSILLLIVIGLLSGCAASRTAQEPIDFIHRPYQLDLGIQTRSVSFENPTGAPGQGGQAASKLGVGRKGHPAETIPAGKTIQLCDISGPGVIRHIWMTGPRDPISLRSVVLRVYWEGQTHPSIECPYGDFFGSSHGHIIGYQSAVHSITDHGGMNIWLPMPFSKHARMTLTNEGKTPVSLFYQIDFTAGDKFLGKVGRLHVLFSRQNPTTEKKDFEILPLRKGPGRYIGTVIGVRNLHTQWWGEGEVKMYLDNDTDFPTYCGTGSEDYIGHAYGIQKFPFLYNGSSLSEQNFYTIYRWHLADPVVWTRQARITIQQIAYSRKGILETSDDWSCATFWYEPSPSAPLPPMPDLAARTADIWAAK
jgi:hypothetical protein